VPLPSARRDRGRSCGLGFRAAPALLAFAADAGPFAALAVEGYVVTKQWAARHPRTLATFYKALEEGQRIADASRAAVEQAMVDMPAPFGVSAETAAVMALDSYPVSTGPVGSVDKVRLQRVVDVMQQFLAFGKFDIDSMLMGRG